MIPPVLFPSTYDLGAYRLSRVLRRAGPLAVCEGVHRRLGVSRQIKIVVPSAVSPFLVMRFLRQTRTTAAARHPALPPILDFGRLPAGGAFVVGECLPGEPASRWLARMSARRIEPLVAAAVTASIAGACAALHRQGVVHGDLRPANLRLAGVPGQPSRFAVKLLGGEEGGVRALQLTTGAAVPWLPYLAPERWQAGSAPDRRSDVYALGCLFFELLTGRPPFLGTDTAQLRIAHLMDAAPDPRWLAPGLGTPELGVELRRVVRRMLVKEPEARYQSMEDVVAALERVLGRERLRSGELLQAPAACPVADVSLADGQAPPLAWLRKELAGHDEQHLVGRVRSALVPLRTIVREALARRRDHTGIDRETDGASNSLWADQVVRPAPRSRP